MKRVYAYRDAPVGYGPRLFVLYDDVPTLDAVLKPLTTWGGYDKDTGKAKGYEFPGSDRTRFNIAVYEVRRLGFEVVDAGAENADEFWD